MPIDMRIRRAAGVIVGKYGRINKSTGEPYTWTQAVALASYREPELTEDELVIASEYAEAALRFRELATLACGRLVRTTDPDTGRVTVSLPGGCESITLGELIDKSGLRPFVHHRYSN